MVCTADHTFTHPRDCLGHLMSVNITARLKLLGVACPSFYFPDLLCHLTNLPWVFGRWMTQVGAGSFSVVRHHHLLLPFRCC
jgi:hypothetical protein